LELKSFKILIDALGPFRGIPRGEQCTVKRISAGKNGVTVESTVGILWKRLTYFDIHCPHQSIVPRSKEWACDSLLSLEWISGMTAGLRPERLSWKVTGRVRSGKPKVGGLVA